MISPHTHSTVKKAAVSMIEKSNEAAPFYQMRRKALVLAMGIYGANMLFSTVKREHAFAFIPFSDMIKAEKRRSNHESHSTAQAPASQRTGTVVDHHSNSVSGLSPSGGRCGNKYNYSLIAISLEARL